MLVFSSFSVQAQSGAVTRTGCLLFKDNRFILQDQSTQEVAELRGPELASHTGDRVAIRGLASKAKAAVSIATMVIHVSAVSPVAPGGCLSVAAVLEASSERPTHTVPRLYN